LQTPHEERIRTDNFQLDLGRYDRTLAAVREATTNQEKKESFEELASILFSGVTYLSVRDKNLRTTMSEIDLVVEYKRAAKMTAFDDHSRFVLVECKNWKSSVGAPQVRDFKSKMKSAKIELGFLFARKGVSERNRAENALGEIQSAFNAENIAIVVIDGNDLRRISEGRDFYQTIDEKLYNLRFRSINSV
jgi:hypothetical protein